MSILLPICSLTKRPPPRSSRIDVVTSTASSSSNRGVWLGVVPSSSISSYGSTKIFTKPTDSNSAMSSTRWSCSSVVSSNKRGGLSRKMAVSESGTTAAAVSISSGSERRPLVNFHPDIWGDYFLNHTMEDKSTLAQKNEQIEELKRKARKELIVASATTTASQNHLMNLIDDIQRLGLAYHFENEIREALKDVYKASVDDHDDLYTVSLRFRLLRQQGFDVSSDDVKKFTDENGKFKDSLTSDVKGMLSLYEAANLGKPEGDDILDEALSFTTAHLRSVVKSNDCSLVQPIIHALKLPLLKSFPRLEARRYIPIYEENVSHNKDLLELAKLDFNYVQSLYKQEIRELVKWWRDMEVERKLPYARSRVVEVYFWSNVMLPEPQHRLARVILTKVFAVATVMDDTYDNYGTFEELQLLTAAIERWSVDCVDQVPENLRACYQLLLDTYEEIEEVMARQYQSFRVPYAKRTMIELVQAYFTEARWLKEGHKPSMEEYLRNAYASSGTSMTLITSLVGMGDAIVTKYAFDWLESKPKSLMALTVICRLMDDIAFQRKFEQEGTHIETAVDVYMREYNVSEKQAKEELQDRIGRAWKDINEQLILKPAPMALLARILNFGRAMSITYLDGIDGYTNAAGRRTKEIITSLFVDPVSL